MVKYAVSTKSIARLFMIDKTTIKLRYASTRVSGIRAVPRKGRVFPRPSGTAFSYSDELYKNSLSQCGENLRFEGVLDKTNKDPSRILVSTNSSQIDAKTSSSICMGNLITGKILNSLEAKKFPSLPSSLLVPHDKADTKSYLAEVLLSEVKWIIKSARGDARINTSFSKLSERVLGCSSTNVQGIKIDLNGFWKNADRSQRKTLARGSLNSQQIDILMITRQDYIVTKFGKCGISLSLCFTSRI